MGIRPPAVCSISLPICSTRKACDSRSDPRARRYAQSAGHLHVEQNELPPRAAEFFSSDTRSNGVVERPRRSQNPHPCRGGKDAAPVYELYFFSSQFLSFSAIASSGCSAIQESSASFNSRTSLSRTPVTGGIRPLTRCKPP